MKGRESWKELADHTKPPPLRPVRNYLKQEPRAWSPWQRCSANHQSAARSSVTLTSRPSIQVEPLGFG